MKPRVIAFYLPQFHPIPENDMWWGKGFTEWTNVGKAKPLFRGHYQPHVPADLGYYDLRVPETRIAQAEMAKEHGVEGFIYWHYWFGNGKRLLERPFNEVLASGQPDFPFALAWANETWKGFAHGLKNRNVLIEQLYPGDEDYIAHFNEVLPAFKDKRYITIDDKPIFLIYKPHQLPDATHFINLWQKLARENGLPGIYFIAHHQSTKEHNFKSEKESLSEMLSMGFDSVNFVRLTKYLENRSLFDKIFGRIKRFVYRIPLAVPYNKAMRYFSDEIDKDELVIPSIIPGWDHSPRSGKEALVLTGSTPEYFGLHVKNVLNNIKDKKNKIVIIKSWNEWAEGNYMEPDLKWGTQFLDVLAKQLK